MYGARMTSKLVTTLKIESWDEVPTHEFPDESRWTRAAVTLAEGKDGLVDGTWEMVMVNLADGTSHYATVMRLSGTLDGRSGSFALVGQGDFDGTTSSTTAAVVPGSGTDGLAALTGRLESVSTHADYPYLPLTLTYDFG